MIEKAELWIACDVPFSVTQDGFMDGRALRGYFGKSFKNRPEFHGHDGEKFIYKHPAIQYKIFEGKALLVGLSEGAYLLKSMPRIESLEIHHEKKAVISQDVRNFNNNFGESGEGILYHFLSPWMALNEENYAEYQNVNWNVEQRKALLGRILIGNILSMAKAFRYEVQERLLAKINLKEAGIFQIKDGLELLGFKGEFEINFYIPDLWGIGKFSSRGYGTVKMMGKGV